MKKIDAHSHIGSFGGWQEIQLKSLAKSSFV